jgi:hypothetical protein
MTAEGLFVRRAMADSGKRAETILSGRNIIKTVRWLSPCANYLTAEAIYSAGQRKM